MNSICSVNIITSVITLGIAIFVAYYGYLQFKIHKDKLRLDLYDRRFEIYDIASEASAVVNYCNANEHTETFNKIKDKLRKAQLQAQFLFAKNKSISDDLMDLYLKFSEYYSYQTQQEKPHETINSLRSEIGNFTHYESNFFQKFKPYLCFQEI